MTSPQPAATAARDGRGVSSDAYGFVGVATPVISVLLQRLRRLNSRQRLRAPHVPLLAGNGSQQQTTTATTVNAQDGGNPSADLGRRQGRGGGRGRVRTCDPPLVRRVLFR